MNANSYTYGRAYTAVYVSDKMRNLLKVLVRYHGLDPQKVVDAWSDWIDRAARTWLVSGHLLAIIVEFHSPGSDNALARWDFPIRYDGNAVDDMWVDRLFFEGSFAKAKAPPAGCSYRILLQTSPGEPYVAGVGNTVLRSIRGLVGREVGTVISTPDIMASARYYRSRLQNSWVAARHRPVLPGEHRCPGLPTACSGSGGPAAKPTRWEQEVSTCFPACVGTPVDG